MFKKTSNLLFAAIFSMFMLTGQVLALDDVPLSYKLTAAWDQSKCLDVKGTNSTSNGKNVQIWDCDEVTERWYFDSNTGRLHAEWAPHMCLDVKGREDVPNGGTNVQIWQCDEVNEIWALDPDYSYLGYFRLTFLDWFIAPGYCLDIAGHNETRNGRNAQIWNCNDVSEVFIRTDVVFH